MFHMSSSPPYLLPQGSNHPQLLKEGIQHQYSNELKLKVPVESSRNKLNSDGYYFDLYQNALKSIETTSTKMNDLPHIHQLPPVSQQVPSKLFDQRYTDGDTPLSASSTGSSHFEYDNLNRWNHEHDGVFWNKDKFSSFDDVASSRHFMESQSVFLSTEYMMHQKEKWRRPRTVYTEKQLESLEKSYKTNKYLRGKERKELCKTLNLEERHVKVWYQNRRAKERSQIRHDKWLLKTKKHKKEAKLNK